MLGYVYRVHGTSIPLLYRVWYCAVWSHVHVHTVTNQGPTLCSLGIVPECHTCVSDGNVLVRCGSHGNCKAKPPKAMASEHSEDAAFGPEAF